MHGGLVCLGANACGHPARPLGLADVHRLRPRAQHHRAEEPYQRGKLGRGPENIQVGPLPQPERQHEPTHREHTTSGTIISGDNISTSQSKTSYNGSYGIDANWTLYNGGRRLNTIKQNELNQRIASLAVSESENSIQESIAQTFVQILYAAEAVKVNEATLETSQAQYERGKQLHEAGSLSLADLAQLEAQVSNDRYQVVTSEATLQDYRLQLKQLLELDGDMEMAAALAPLPQKADVYRAALALRPEIESAGLSVDAADLDIKIARSGYIPSISLTAGIGSSNTKLEQLAGRHPQHPPLGPTADQKRHTQGETAEADQPTGPAGHAEGTLPHHRDPLVGRPQRTAAI